MELFPPMILSKILLQCLEHTTEEVKGVYETLSRAGRSPFRHSREYKCVWRQKLQSSGETEQTLIFNMSNPVQGRGAGGNGCYFRTGGQAMLVRELRQRSPAGSELLHPAGPAALTTAGCCPAVDWGTGCAMLTTNNGSKGKACGLPWPPGEQLPLLLPWHWGTRESSMPTRYEEEHKWGEDKGEPRFQSRECWPGWEAGRKGSFQRLSNGKSRWGEGRWSELLGKGLCLTQ